MKHSSDLPSPPFGRREDLREVLHRVEVADPYRWLEDANSEETREWLAQEQKHAAIYFASTDRQLIHRRLAELMRIDEFGIPLERGGYYYFSRRAAGEQRHCICRRFGLDGPDEVLVSPSEIGADPTIGVELSDVTPNGARLAYLLRRGGQDETEIRVLDVASRRTIDVLPRVKQGSVSWRHDNTGFYYSVWSGEEGHLRFHRIGNSTSEDREILTAGHGEFIEERVSDDGRYLLVHVWPGSAGDETRVYRFSIRKDR
jgi:prolyl oligopeptidase